jgi:basic amino acid/polyamine antiporter, APA family
MIGRATTPVRALSSRRLAALDRSSDPKSLRRELGLFSAALLVVGGIIGSGIFFTPAEVAKALPSGGWILLVWVLGGVVALAGALTYAELGALFPEAGGPYVYIREGFGRLPAFLYGWMLLGVIATGAEAAVALGFANYLGRFVNIAPVGGALSVAITIVVAMTILNYFGIKPGALAQNTFTIAKIVALGMLILGGFALWGRLGGAPAVVNAPAPRTSLLVGLAAAFVPVLFTIGGWQQMNMVAGEIREPSRLIPRALTIGIGIVIAIYLGANVVYLRALGRDGLASSAAVAVDTATRMLGPGGATAITVAAMLSMLGFLNVVILATSRIFYAMARDGVFFPQAAAVHPRYGSPHVAILIMGAWTVVLLIAARGSIGTLLSGVVFADWIFFGLGAASVFAIRKDTPADERSYSVPWYPLLPVFFIVAACFGVVSAIIASPLTSLFGTVLLLVGAGIFRFVLAPKLPPVRAA